MASLQAPLTIISNAPGGGSSRSFQPPAATWFDEDPLHFVALEARPRGASSSSPRHRASGESVNSDSRDGDDSASGLFPGRGSVISGVGSIDSSVLIGGTGGGVHRGSSSANEDEEGDPFEVVRYQAFALPRRNRVDGGGRGDRGGGSSGEGSVVSNASSSSSSRQHVSAFDAAKSRAKAAQDGRHGALAAEISVAFPLPLQLATETSRNDPSILSGQTDEDTCMTELDSRRIPILAKFSPKLKKGGMRFIALQYTATMLRVATVEGGQGADGLGAAAAKVSRRASFSGSKGGIASQAGPSGADGDVHWTIDLSFGAQPVVSRPESLPNFREGSQRNLFGMNPRPEEGIVPGKTSIIGGGVLWSSRGRDETESLDLIVVTTTSVLVYSMNTARRQLVKLHVLPHDVAASFWYEPATRTLVVGSYKSNSSSSSPDASDREDHHNASLASFSVDEGHGRAAGSDAGASSSTFPSAVLSMKTLFFSDDAAASGGSVVETLPSFVVGTLREVVSNADEHHELQLLGESLDTFDSGKLEKKRQQESENAVVLPSEVFVVNLYGSVYCVELGSLGSGQGIGLTKLDREGGCIHVRHQKFDALKGHRLDSESAIAVGVIDNLLCIFSKKEKTTHFIDVAASFSDDQLVYREVIELFEPDEGASGISIHDDRLSFLPPSYFLDTNGQGLLYEVVLSVPIVLKCIPESACIVPFLLRRNLPRNVIRTHIMERFAALVELRDMGSLKRWLTVIVEQYSECDAALRYDFESTVALLPACSLLSIDDKADAGDTRFIDQIMVPSSCSQVLTQTEVLQMILLRHATMAIKREDWKCLKFVASLSVHYFVELERRLITPCAALQCLVVALLWRTGEDAQLTAFLSAQQSQWTITRRRRQMELPSANRMYFDTPGAVSYAETLFLLVQGQNQATAVCFPTTARQLITYATIILLGCGATSLAVKCLLSVGHLNDAISICSKKIRPSKGSEESDSKIAEGTQAKDFFHAAVLNAGQVSSLSERCKSFYLLHCFLKEWDPSTFKMDSRKVKVTRHPRRRLSFHSPDDSDNTIVVEQSVLAHECPRFPDELFGGRDTAQCKRLRSMFGYTALSK